MEAWTFDIAWGKLAALWGKWLWQSFKVEVPSHKSDTSSSRTLILFMSRANLAGPGPRHSRSRISAGNNLNSWPADLCAQCYCLGSLWCEKALEHHLRRATLTEEGAVIPLESSWPCKAVVRWGYPCLLPWNLVQTTEGPGLVTVNKWQPKTVVFNLANSATL